MYPTLRKVLFALDPELSHDFSLESLAAAERLRLIHLFAAKMDPKPVNVMGLTFQNPVGLAAGLDKNGDYFNALGQLGFGFVEIGTVTPQPQPGNPPPRMFRLVEEEALINRMGFNNKGVDYLVKRVAQRRYSGVLGINLGKNKATPEGNALSDYTRCMDKVYSSADYITINISSPNTPGLRNLQHGEALNTLLGGLNERRKMLSDAHSRHVPIAVKIAPDCSDTDLHSVTDTMMKHKMDAVIATNTTLSRKGVEANALASEVGGLSGKPLCERATEVIHCIKNRVGEDLPIIGVGGITSVQDARAKLDAGASLLQLYTGFIYHGPSLIEDIVKSLPQPSR